MKIDAKKLLAAGLVAGLIAGLVLLAGCTKKSKEVVEEVRWTGNLEIQGIPLSPTLTVYSDKSFILDTTVSFFGIGMDFTKVGSGTVQGDPKKDGELVFTLETLAPDILPILEAAGAVEIPLPLTVSAVVEGDAISLEDVGLGQEIRLSRE